MKIFGYLIIKPEIIFRDMCIIAQNWEEAYYMKEIERRKLQSKYDKKIKKLKEGLK